MIPGALAVNMTTRNPQSTYHAAATTTIDRERMGEIQTHGVSAGREGAKHGPSTIAPTFPQQNESTMGEDANFSPGAEERPQRPCQARVEEESKDEDGNSIVRLVEPGTERVDDHTNETGDIEASVTRVEEMRSYYQALQAHLVGSRNNDPEEECRKVKEQAELAAREKFLAEATEAQIVDDDAQKRLTNRLEMYYCPHHIGGHSGGGLIYHNHLLAEAQNRDKYNLFKSIWSIEHYKSGEIRKQNGDFYAYCQVKFNGGNGQWYKLIGQNGSRQASICDSNQGRTYYDIEILVFSGDCQNLECIGGSDQLCGDHASVGWLAIEGMEYYLLARGNRESTVGDYGIF